MTWNSPLAGPMGVNLCFPPGADHHVIEVVDPFRDVAAQVEQTLVVGREAAHRRAGDVAVIVIGDDPAEQGRGLAVGIIAAVFPRRQRPAPGELEHFA